MKKYLILLILSIGFVSVANGSVSNANQIRIINMFEQVGMESMWPQDISLWVKNPGYTKFELESIGHLMCEGARNSGIGFFNITFWHSFGRGEITKVSCW